MSHVTSPSFANTMKDSRVNSSVGHEIEETHRELLKIRDESGQTIPYEFQLEFLNQTHKKKYRFLMLVLGSLFVFGNYFYYDYPGSLEDSIKRHF